MRSKVIIRHCTIRKKWRIESMKLLSGILGGFLGVIIAIFVVIIVIYFGIRKIIGKNSKMG